MRIGEFKEAVLRLNLCQGTKEIKRLQICSNSRMKGVTVDKNNIGLKNISTDKEVRILWRNYNKKEADWESYCRKSAHEAKMNKYRPYVDYSHLAYNGVTEDF